MRYERIVVTDLETRQLIFDGTEEQFQDCFFTNTDEETICAWSKDNGFAVRFVRSPDDWAVKGVFSKPHDTWTADGNTPLWKCPCCTGTLHRYHNFCPTCGVGVM